MVDQGARPDVLVIGGGVIGLAVAWRCLRRGLRVTVVDPRPGSGASRTAAGMLAPVTELHYGEEALLALNLASAARYPNFVAELTDATGLDCGYRETGTVVAAWDAADLASLRDHAAFARTLGRTVDELTGRELRKLVPGIAPGLPGGLLAADDHQVDNRLLHAALRAAVVDAGGRIVADRAVSIRCESERVTGVRAAAGNTIPADVVVLAAGAHSRGVDGVAAEALPPVRPVKGQTLRLRMPAGAQPPRIVRGAVRGSPVYLVPRRDQELVVGASSEEAGFDCSPRAGAVYELLRDAQSLLPAVAEAELVEVSTGLRPGSPDNAPIVGRTGPDGLIVATGHYRNGILLTPITGDAVAALVVDGALPAEFADFTPERFAAQEVCP